MTRMLPLFLAAAALPGLAQPPQPVQSPEVHANSSVTFRLRAPNVKQVLLSREGAERVPMQRGQDGVWTVTVQTPS